MMTVFVLDADTNDLDQLSTQLTQTGEVVIVGTAAKPGEAIEQMVKLQPDVLFLDLELPDMHGIQVVELIRKQQLNLCIVIVTRDTSFALVAFEHHVVDFVEKPWTAARLDSTISRLKRELN